MINQESNTKIIWTFFFLFLPFYFSSYHLKYCFTSFIKKNRNRRGKIIEISISLILWLLIVALNWVRLFWSLFHCQKMCLKQKVFSIPIHRPLLLVYLYVVLNCIEPFHYWQAFGHLVETLSLVIVPFTHICVFILFFSTFSISIVCLCVLLNQKVVDITVR